MDGSPLPRCNSESYYSSNSAHRVRCPADMIVNPMNIARIEKNVELRKASEYTEAVQVKPQHVYLKLRISKLHVDVVSKLHINVVSELHVDVVKLYK